MVECLFGQVQSELAEGEGWEAASRIAADGKVVEERAVFALGAIVCLANNGGGVGVEIADEMGKAMVIGGRIIRCANPEA